MKKRLKRVFIACLCVTAGLLTGCVCNLSGGKISEYCSIKPREAGRFLDRARIWGEQLWTNDCCVLENAPYGSEPPVWTVSQKFHAVLSSAEWVVDELMNQDAYWREQVLVAFNAAPPSAQELCFFAFLRTKPYTVTWVKNHLYSEPNIPYRQDNKPIHTTSREASQSVAAYAALFGVSNIWDEARFMSGIPSSYENGEWKFVFHAVRNGFPTPYGISVSVADLPGAPLGEWNNATDKIPEQLPTKMSVTSELATIKAREYLKEYCTRKEIIPNASFVTNSVQYVVSQMNYIKKNECRLAWVNTFQIPQHEKARLNNSIPIEICACGFPKTRLIADFHTVVITVDAETGKCLGSDDWE